MNGGEQHDAPQRTEHRSLPTRMNFHTSVHEKEDSNASCSAANQRHERTQIGLNLAEFCLPASVQQKGGKVLLLLRLTPLLKTDRVRTHQTIEPQHPSSQIEMRESAPRIPVSRTELSMNNSFPKPLSVVALCCFFWGWWGQKQHTQHLPSWWHLQNEVFTPPWPCLVNLFLFLREKDLKGWTFNCLSPESGRVLCQACQILSQKVTISTAKSGWVLVLWKRHQTCCTHSQ